MNNTPSDPLAEPSEKFPLDLVVVLGMHRSGTSAMTRGLEALGVKLGDRLMPSVPGNNEKGFYEDIDFNNFDIELLAHIDLDWHHAAPITEHQVNKLCADGYLLRAVTLLRGKLSPGNIFGIKDPRIAKLMPFWIRVFAHCKLRVGYVLAVRNPISVAESLRTRDGLEFEKSYLLWLDHTLTALACTQDSTRVFIDFDAVLADPTAQLKRMAGALGLPIDADAMRVYAAEFVDTHLRHAIHHPEDLATDVRVLEVVADLYSVVRVAAEGEASPSLSVHKVAELRAAASAMLPAITYIDKLCCDREILTRALAGRDDQISKLNQVVVEQEDQIVNLHQTAVERDTEVSTLKEKVAERDGQINNLSQVIANHEVEIANLNQLLVERKEQAASLERMTVEWNGEISRLNDALRDTRRELENVLSSKSWRLTKPLRFIRRAGMSKPIAIFRETVSNISRHAWHAAPISFDTKRKFKQFAFSNFSWLFSWSKAYQSWVNFTSPMNSFSAVPRVVEPQLITEDDEYVPLLAAEPLKNKPVKVICFYLPQYHPIPENNVWWGEGFTEWTNVRPAKPQFAGHYQPHIPGELGYYNLLDGKVQRRQVELAKLYGVGGFCFYFYWFAGKRLLETPVANYLTDPSLDLPFCLCWANENWSRRWDGLDSEILMAQQHSEADDIAFIEHVSRYMRDPRYIRIDGKPLLLVYRPSLLPSAKETALRWRKWCKENDIGEIYLAYTQSFEAVDPAGYGFDAAIEFPPNNSAPPNVTQSVAPLNDDFAATVYDWSIFVERSKAYKKTKYKIFRSACPAWDNTARRKNKGIIFIKNTPNLFQQWLQNAIRNTLESTSNEDEKLIFINAWNEWAEGAHLEPDAKYGYANLQAVRDALSFSMLDRTENNISRKDIAVVIHVHYPEVLSEIIEILDKDVIASSKIYITTSSGNEAAVKEIIGKSNINSTLILLPNRGRDILPFLKILPSVIADGAKIIIKIHTKKSTHRHDGDTWRRDMLQKLLTAASVTNALNKFNENFSLGIVGPEGHVVPMTFYWGSNADRVTTLANKMGISAEKVAELNFVAGTMFIARTTALLPLLELGLQEHDFENENGQIDGTLAHAIERLFSVSALTRGYKVATVNNIVTKNFSFADRVIANN